MLCVIHCAITPLLFLSHAAAMSQGISKPIWWSNLDYLFIIISFFLYIMLLKIQIEKS
nr:MerC family mercury resistance protein [Nonlabens xylanidelens]